jgi:Multisubunit Na+/H+ antiporter, MnhF subunit
MTQLRSEALTVSAVILAALMLAALVRAVLGPRFTDRIVAVNMINTMAVAVLVILSVRLREDFLVDVALVYALLSFLTVAVLSRMVTARQRRKQQEKKRGKRHNG